MQIQIPFTRFFQIISVIMSLGKRYDYPTAQLPANFRAGPNLRESRSGFRGDFVSSEINDNRPPPFVSTDVGNFEGYFMKVISGREIYAFEGIRYGTAMRFHDPLPSPPFQGNFSAKSPGNDCFQTYSGTVLRQAGDGFQFGDEDCLFCNVYSPKIWENGRNPNLPVYFNIYGGNFARGTARDYGPAYLLEQDLVYVGCNYRVGPFGFLSTGDSAASGNWGLKDVALGLDWTYKHISRFGGDPNRIIVMGESAGAALGHLLLMSPVSKNQIAGTVLISGNSFTSWGVMDTKGAQKITSRFALINFCPTHQGNLKMIECLRRRSKSRLELAGNLIRVTEQSLFQFGPVIEPDIEGALITKTPEDYYKEGLVPSVPAMFSENSRDADIANIPIRFTGAWPLIGQTFLSLLPQLLNFRGRVRNEDEVAKKILNFYSGTGGIKSLLVDGSPIFEAAQYRYFTRGWRQSMLLHSQIAPTFGYILGHRTKRGLAGRVRLDPYEFGVPHAEDLLYVFNRTDVEPISRSHPDFDVVKLYQNIFTNFATYGEPLFTTGDNIAQRLSGPVTPPPSENFKIFHITDEEVKIEELRWNTNVSQFWDSLNIQDLPSS